MTDEFDFDLSGFDEELQETLKKGREAFHGKYKSELTELMGLSREEIDQVTADTTDVETYDMLIEIVKDASAKNLAQAELKARIEKLGQLAIELGRRVPSVAKLLV